MRNLLVITTTTTALLASTALSFAGMDEAKAFLDAEIGELSTLDRAAQEAEMQWFVDAAKPFADMEIKVVSETIDTHSYESKILAPAFTAITGIKITHDLIGEGDVVEKLQTQMQSGENIYDAYINDSDLIGTHWRYKQARSLTEWMAGEGKDVTNPGLDLADFIGTQFTTRQTASSISFPTSNSRTSIGSAMTGSTTTRTRPISRPNTATISAFRSTGRLTKISPISSPAAISATWVFRRSLWQHGLRQEGPVAWLALHRCMDVDGRHGPKGEPNGLPVDEWGIRVNDKSQPVGSCVAPRRRDQWPGGSLRRLEGHRVVEKIFATRSGRHDLLGSRPDPRAGQCRPADVLVHRFHRRNGQTRPASDERGRHAEMAHGPLPAWRLLDQGHEDRLSGCGFVDADEIDPGDRAKAAWLYAQFVTSKTVDVKKSDVGLTFIRESTIQSDHFTQRANKLGGLIEFYRSPARVAWSPTGTNVPDYPKLAQLWWQNIGDAMSGAKTPQEALDGLCSDQEKVMERLERAGIQGDIGPKMNEPKDAAEWLAEPGSPKAKLDNERPAGETVAYDELIKSWQQ